MQNTQESVNYMITNFL